MLYCSQVDGSQHENRWCHMGNLSKTFLPTKGHLGQITSPTSTLSFVIGNVGTFD